jgi:hypothetical protein
MTILSSSTSRVMLNSSPLPAIQHRRGFVRGTPFRPFFLILVIDPLNRLLQVAIERGFLMKLNGRAVRFRVFMYADDAVIFLKPTITDVCNLDMLLNFGAVIRLQTI